MVGRESTKKAEKAIGGLKGASDDVAAGVSGFLAGSVATLSKK